MPPNLSSTSAPSSMALFLLCRCTTVTLTPPPLRPASRQPLLSSASAAAHLFIVVICHCPPRLFSHCCPPNNCSSNSTTVPAFCQPLLLSAFATAHLLIVDFCLDVSAVVALPPLTVHCVSSAAVVLHLIRRHPPPHPTIVPSPQLRVLRIS